MFEDIDWGTYFTVQINGLTPDIDMMIHFNGDIANEKKHDVMFAVIDFINTCKDVKTFKVQEVNAYTLNLTMDVGGKGQILAEKVLAALNEVSDIKSVSVD